MQFVQETGVPDVGLSASAGRRGRGGLGAVTDLSAVGGLGPGVAMGLGTAVRLGAAVGVGALTAAMAACGAPPEGDSRTDDGPEAAAVRSAPGGEILVSAAASLTDAFADIESAFEAGHPEVDVTLNLAGSSRLRVQILEGAPVDVFASADVANVERVAAAGELAGGPRIFARNLLRIAVPPGNAAGVSGLGDFAREELVLGLCAAAVPCGVRARRALARAGVTAAPDTEEPDVRALLTKVELGELDAGIAYVTDVAAAGGAVEGIDIPADENVATEYAIAVLAGASDRETARVFMDFVLSTEGQAILARHGFLAVSPPP